jgi:hypothetical protein
MLKMLVYRCHTSFGPTICGLNSTIFLDIEPCGPYMNKCFGGNYHLHLQCRKSAEEEISIAAGE